MVEMEIFQIVHLSIEKKIYNFNEMLRFLLLQLLLIILGIINLSFNNGKKNGEDNRQFK